MRNDNPQSPNRQCHWAGQCKRNINGTETAHTVVGQLTGELFERLNAVRARLQAEADMAQATREERKREARDRLRLPAKVEAVGRRTSRGSAPRKQSAAH